jgi:hypothetical protein
MDTQNIQHITVQMQVKALDMASKTPQHHSIERHYTYTNTQTVLKWQYNNFCYIALQTSAKLNLLYDT